MTDTLYNTDQLRPVRGALNANTGLVTAGAGEIIHIRNARICNNHASNGGWMLLSVGDAAVATNHVMDWLYVPPGQSMKIPLDVTLQNNEVLRGRQINDQQQANLRMNLYGTMMSGNSTTDGTSFVTGTWSPNGGWDYVLNIVNSHATAAEVPTSVVDNHTGPATIAQLQTVLAPNGLTRITTYRVESGGSPGSAATLTITFSGAQTGCAWIIDEIVNGDGSASDTAVHAAGTYAQAATRDNIKVPATMPVGARYVCVATQTGTGVTAWDGWTSVGSTAYSTPATTVKNAWIHTAGDQYGYMATSSLANTIISMVGLQGDVNAMDRNTYAGLTVMFNGVSIT
jgi:hypothetical protein